MKRKIEISELIFKIIAYVVLIVFALMCIYPLIFALAATFSDPLAVNKNLIVLWPAAAEGGLGFSTEAVMIVLKSSTFWIYYSNTFFVTFLGTLWSMFFTIFAAYALSKKRLMGRHAWNFFLVFTMWFSAGIVASYNNFQRTGEIFASFVGGQSMYDIDLKWMVVIAMGANATNLILLRNSFEGVPSEIEEAARIDGATEFQILWRVYIPMSKATIATVALFFGIGRWNGYFWSYKIMGSTQDYNWPVQVYIRDFIDRYTNMTGKLNPDELDKAGVPTSIWDPVEGNATATVYSMVLLSIIPILVVYPFVQKYFAKGVNMGGVKE